MSFRIALVSMNPFPVGNVSTIRYSSYCRALSENGYFVKVYIPAPSKTASPNKTSQGVERGVHFEYMYKNTAWKRRPIFPVAVLIYFLGLVKVLFKLRSDRINLVILYSNDALSYILLFVFSFLFSVPVVTDKSEYPYGYHRMGSFGRMWEHLKLKVFDGFVVMTNELQGFYSRFKRKGALVFKLPITVDQSRFSSTPLCSKADFITCVFGVHNRDCLEDTISAYNIYRFKAGEAAFKLRLVGDFIGLVNHSELTKMISDFGLDDCIEFSGVVPSSMIPDLLLRSACLITTPRSYYSGGFPTKLAEYLLSGVPVVTTTAGEIGYFLSDGVDSLLAPPGDLNLIADKLWYLTSHPEDAKRIGEGGRNLAEREFSIGTYVSDLSGFLERVVGLK